MTTSPANRGWVGKRQQFVKTEVHSESGKPDAPAGPTEILEVDYSQRTRKA